MTQATYDKRHARSVLATAALTKHRFATLAGVHAGAEDDVAGATEGDVAAGRLASLITGFSALVEAAGVIASGDQVGPAGDGTGRAVSGGACGRALSSAMAAGELVEVELYPYVGLAASKVDALQAMAAAYSQQPATWYAGEIASVLTPAILANGDLNAGTDLVPLLWRIVPQGEDDVAAAQQLKDGGPNIITLGLGDFDEKSVKDATGGAAEVLTAAYVVCVSATAVPGSYAGSSNIVAQADTNLANWLAAMKRVDWSGGLGATFIRAKSTAAYGAGTLQSQLVLEGGVV